MDRLERNWLTNGLIDLEYKKYTLLSYLTHVQKQFEDVKLYPFYQDIREHLVDLNEYKLSKVKINSIFPKEFEGIDLDNFKIKYKKTIKDSDLIEEIDAIVEFGLNSFTEKLSLGKTLLDYVVEQILIEPIGISPIDKTEGYLFICSKNLNEVEIYKYFRSPVKSIKNDIEEIRTSFITTMRVSLSNTLEQIKKDLLKIYRDLPNPATFLVASKVDVPHQETLIPVAKKLLVKQIAA
jgi:hypothetical protein